MQAQEAVAQAVERAQPHGAQRHGQHGAQPRLHFFGGLVGERYRQNIVHAGHAVLQQPGNAGRQNAGFAAARPRQHQHGLRRIGHGGKLFGIQTVQ